MSLRLVIAPLVATILVLTSCSGGNSRALPSLPEKPIHVATLQDAQSLIAETFQCELESSVGDIALHSDSLKDFEDKHAKDMNLLAIATDDNTYIWVSQDGKRSVYARVQDKTKPVSGGLMAGCQN